MENSWRWLIFIFVVAFVLVPPLMKSGLFLTQFRNHTWHGSSYGMPGIERWFAVCKISAQLAVLSF